MNVSAWSIRHPVPGILLFGLLTVIGILLYTAIAKVEEGLLHYLPKAHS